MISRPITEFVEYKTPPPKPTNLPATEPFLGYEYTTVGYKPIISLELESPLKDY